MNKVVKHEHIAAAALPEALRGGIPADAMVTVTIEEEGREQTSVADLMKRIHAYRASPEFQPVTDDDAVRRIRDLRDEWD